jgi:hypothetical protein
MSVVFLSNGEPTGQSIYHWGHQITNLSITNGFIVVTPEAIQAIASAHNFNIPDQDEKDYLFLLNSLDATLNQVADLPAYVDPRLEPEEGTLPRKWNIVVKNPLNAWACQVGCKFCF